MKKMIFIVLVFILSINIFAKTNVEKQVEKIREEFTKINSEKNYKVETVDGPGSEMSTEYYRKNGELKKVVEYVNIPISDYTMQYYINDDKVFFAYETTVEYKTKNNGMIDEKKFKKTEKRYYFDDDGTLIRYIENGKTYDGKKIPKKYKEAAESIPRDASEL